MFNRFNSEVDDLNEFDNRRERFDPEEASMWEKKEQESREEISKKFGALVDEMHDGVKEIINIVKESESKDLAFFKRVNINEEDLNTITENIRNLNFSLGKAKPMLDSYIRFSNTTPDFKTVNHMIFQLNSFVVDTQRKRFYQIHETKYDNRWFKRVPLLKLANDLSFLIERILGALEIGGEYIVDIGKMSNSKRTNPRESGYDRWGMSGNRYDPGYYGGNRYNSGSRYDKFGRKIENSESFEGEQRKKTPEQTPPRDVGDSYQPAEVP